MTGYTKLIERLRDNTARHDDESRRLCNEAAEDIEALQAEVERLKERTQTLLDDCNTWAQELKNERRLSFRAERDQLQAELDAMGNGEPVATVTDNFATDYSEISRTYQAPIPIGTKLYAAPKALAPLTDEQLFANDDLLTINAHHIGDFNIVRKITRAVEAAHGIGGTP